MAKIDRLKCTVRNAKRYRKLATYRLIWFFRFHRNAAICGRTTSDVSLYIVYMGVVLGPEKMNNICRKTMHMGTMDRGFTVLLCQMCLKRNRQFADIKHSFWDYFINNWYFLCFCQIQVEYNIKYPSAYILTCSKCMLIIQSTIWVQILVRTMQNSVTHTCWYSLHHFFLFYILKSQVMMDCNMFHIVCAKF
jgi:hypothetical protein